MFESAELEHKIDRSRYAREVPRLREALLNAQYDLATAKRFALIIVIGGVDGAGKGETVNLLNEWIDPRHIQAHAFSEPSDEERSRPRMWRYWRSAAEGRDRHPVRRLAHAADRRPGPWSHRQVCGCPVC